MAVYDFITQPFRYSESFDAGVRAAFSLARQVEVDGRLTSLADSDAVCATLFNIMKAPRLRFNVAVLGTNIVVPNDFDGSPPCATLFSDRFGLQSGRLVVIPDFVIDPNSGQTILRCWG